MSVAVDLARLRDEVEGFDRSPYLLTVADDGRPRVVNVNVIWDGDALMVDVGARTSANVGQRPEVTLLWPPPLPGQMSLIVDGHAVLDAAGGQVRIEPTSAVLHRSP